MAEQDSASLVSSEYLMADEDEHHPHHPLHSPNETEEPEAPAGQDENEIVVEDLSDLEEDGAASQVSSASSTSSLASLSSSNLSLSCVRPEVNEKQSLPCHPLTSIDSPLSPAQPTQSVPRKRRSSSGLLASIRKSGRRLLSPVLAVSGRGMTGDGAYRDILSITIHCQMWHLTNLILSYLDAVSLETCEEVCLLWKNYISSEHIWKRVVELSATMAPDMMKQNGWANYLSVMGGKDPSYDKIYRQLYWKMTNLSLLWKYRGSSERKNHIRRSGSINWCFLRSGRSISVYTRGHGYVLKIHEDTTHRFRHAQTVTLGTVKKDNLCLDASDKLIVVGGLVSQKVWVFNIKEGRQPVKGALDLLFEALNRQSRSSNDRGTRIYTDIFKFINAGAGVSKVKLHSDGKRMAVLLPLNQTVEIWDISDVIRLQSYTVRSDAFFMTWKNDLLVTATVPIDSGTIQAINTESETELCKLFTGNNKPINALAVYGRLCATGEGAYIKLWNLNTSRPMTAWKATRTYITALFMNDALIASGSYAGIVKLWELRSILRKNATSLQPLRRISMKGMMQYPIKLITQLSYVDMVIVAKYEDKKKKDKVKFFRVKADDAPFPK